MHPVRPARRTGHKAGASTDARPARRQEVAVTKTRVHDPSIRRAAPAWTPHGTLGAVAAALGALRGWWVAGRHYRPERRYMRGGRTHAQRALARR